MPNNKILFITYYYPPRGGVAVMRTIKFIKYLSALGWDPMVLTWRSNENIMIDDTLSDEVPDSVQVYRVPSLGKRYFDLMAKLGLKEWTLFPDKASGWIPWAVLKGVSLIAKHRIPFIVSTSPPHSAQLVGYLCKRFTGASWVADFRDLWCGNSFFVPEWDINSRLHKKWESCVIENADHVLANTQKALSFFNESYPETRSKFSFLPNGFDPEDFIHCKTSEKKEKELRLTYVGTFGGARPMDNFFQALKRFFSEKPGARKVMKIYFVGMKSVLVARAAKRFSVDDIVVFTGHLAHGESIQHMIDADILLLFQFKSHGGDSALPSKVFEYLRAKKPIFAQACKGPTTDFLSSIESAYICDPEDPTAIYEKIKQLYSDYEKGELKECEYPEIEQYDRAKQAKVLHNILTGL